MNKMTQIFEYIKENKNMLSAVQKGEDFEDVIYRTFRRFGLTRYTSSDDSLKEFIKTIKPIAQSKNSNNVCDNTSGISDWFIPQAYGSQAVPDILCSLDNKTFPIEIKCSQKGNIVWNGSFARENCLYIVCNISKRDITFFNGSDILNKEQRDNLLKFWELLSDICKDEMFENQYGFKPYLRQTYTDKGISWTSLTNREELENKCLEFINNLN